jgi:HEAT repeat protein
MAELAKLLRQLVHGTLQEQIQAAHVLPNFGEEVVEPLIDLLRNPDAKNSWWLIADALGRIDDRRAVDPLIALLKDPLSFEAILSRKYTAGALGKLKDPRAVDALIELLHESSYDEDYDREEPDNETIADAIWALFEIGDARAVAPMIQRLLEGDFWQEDLPWSQWGDTALNLILEAVKSPSETVRDGAAGLLGQFDHLDSLEPLIDLLQNDHSDRVRNAAAHALSYLRDPRAFDALLWAALHDSHDQTRDRAVTGLQMLKDERAIEVLKKALQDEDPTVWAYAQSALKWFGE